MTFLGCIGLLAASGGEGDGLLLFIHDGFHPLKQTGCSLLNMQLVFIWDDVSSYDVF